MRESADLMCDHCGCQGFPLIESLTQQHRHIQEAAGLLRRAIGRGEHEAARRLLTALTGLLVPHVTAEEQGLFAELRTDETIRATIEQLCAEHIRLEETLRQPPSDEQGWTQVLAVLDLLAEHIFKEEYGVFPAAVVMLPTPVWDRLTDSCDDAPTGAESQGLLCWAQVDLSRQSSQATA